MSIDTSSGPVVSGAAMRAAVTESLASIAANADRAEQERRVPDENIAALREAGLFRALQPSRYGGTPMGAEEYTPALVDIAGACASTAWVAGLLAQHSHLIGLMSAELQDEVWADDPTALASSSVAAINGCEEVPGGGVRLNGSWGWSSGCDHASWAILGFRRADPVLGGMVIPHFAVVPKADYRIHDDWFVAALRGTGSKTLVVDDVYVPEHRIESFLALGTGTTKGFGLHGGIFHAAFVNWFSLGFSAVSLGIARRFIEVYREKVSSRVRAYTGAKVADSAAAAMRIAESHHQTTAVYHTLHADWSAMTARALAGELPTDDEAVHWRSNQAYATKQSIEAVDRLWSASGGSAFFDSNEMQRLWRDSKMTGSHAYSDYDIAAQKHGRHLLGLPPDMTLF
ncbi:MAG: acyl-CoA dehydrogenase family protein [Ilumatobacteraceae bacterium]|nr:acyl-CoA dehydrogenase family protein [Ilumatobacter sp.]MCO5330301.1 acyl-CoA dehydrogenase family protein [Ilumatobacteraceae bacterium]